MEKFFFTDINSFIKYLVSVLIASAGIVFDTEDIIENKMGMGNPSLCWTYILMWEIDKYKETT